MDYVSRTARVHACSHGALELQLETQDCAACCSAAICAAGRSGSRVHRIAVNVQVAPGERLAMQIDAALLGRISLLSYLLPAAMMLATAGIAGCLTSFADDRAALVGAAAGLMLSGLLLRLYDSRHGFRLWQVEPVGDRSLVQASVDLQKL